MTKKGIVLAVILTILLLGIIISATIQSCKVNKEIKVQAVEETESKKFREFALDVTSETGFDLEDLKLYGLPILIQIGSSLDETCNDMKSDIVKLNEETMGKAIVKYIDTEHYKDLWTESRVLTKDSPVQVLIDKDGKPYETTASEALGYKKIKDETGKHIYTVHDGDLTFSEMMGILKELGMR